MSREEVVIANAVAIWKSTYERANRFFANLDGEDLLKEVAPGRNRLIYLWGHLTTIHDRMFVLLGLGERIAPDFDASFLTSPDKAAELPSVERIRETWNRVSDRLNQGIAATTAEEWVEKHSAVSDADFAIDPLRNRLAVLLSRTNHLSYHLGQVNLVTRKGVS